MEEKQYILTEEELESIQKALSKFLSAQLSPVSILNVAEAYRILNLIKNKDLAKN